MFIRPHGLRYDIFPIPFPSHPENTIPSADDIPHIMTVLIVRLTSSQWLARPCRGSSTAFDASKKSVRFIWLQDDPKKGGKIRKMYGSFQ
jgi:hypothetical protein